MWQKNRQAKVTYLILCVSMDNEKKFNSITYIFEIVASSKKIHEFSLQRVIAVAQYGKYVYLQ
jgi:hypothetical protein